MNLFFFDKRLRFEIHSYIRREYKWYSHLSSRHSPMVLNSVTKLMVNMIATLPTKGWCAGLYIFNKLYTASTSS